MVYIALSLTKAVAAELAQYHYDTTLGDINHNSSIVVVVDLIKIEIDVSLYGMASCDHHPIKLIYKTHTHTSPTNGNLIGNFGFISSIIIISVCLRTSCFSHFNHLIPSLSLQLDYPLNLVVNNKILFISLLTSYVRKS